MMEWVFWKRGGVKSSLARKTGGSGAIIILADQAERSQVSKKTLEVRGSSEGAELCSP